MSTRTALILGLALSICGWTAIASAQTWDHIHLVASDTKAAAEWYAKHFGGEITKSGPFDAVLFGSNLMKFKRGDAETQGSYGSVVDHLAFSVESATGKAEELAADGATVTSPNRRTTVVRQATDPWGTKIELLQDEDLRGFHHVHLRMVSSSTATDWYTAVFGGEAASFKDAAGVKAIRYNDMYVFIQRTVRDTAPTTGRSIDHIGWRFDDFDAIIKRLKGMDVKFVVEPTQSGDHRIAFIEDPSGTKIEIVETSPQ